MLRLHTINTFIVCLCSFPSIATANSAAEPATILVSNGTYVLGIPTLHITCPGLVMRSADGDREAVIIKGPNEGPGAAVGNVFLVSADNVTIADMTFGYCRYHGVQIQALPHNARNQ